MNSLSLPLRKKGSLDACSMALTANYLKLTRSSQFSKNTLSTARFFFGHLFRWLSDIFEQYALGNHEPVLRCDLTFMQICFLDQKKIVSPLMWIDYTTRKPHSKRPIAQKVVLCNRLSALENLFVASQQDDVDRWALTCLCLSRWPLVRDIWPLSFQLREISATLEKNVPNTSVALQRSPLDQWTWS